MPEKTNVN